MLALKIGEYFADLPADFSITWNKKNPIFNDVGGYTYPFKLPSTHRNRFIFSHCNRITSTTDLNQEYDCTLLWKSSVICMGTLKIKSSADNYFEGTIYEGDGDFFYRIKDQYLTQYDFGGESFDTEELALEWINRCAGSYYPDEAVAFPEVYNDLYFDPPVTAIELQYYNFYGVDGEITLGGTGDVADRRTIIVPMLYMRYVLEKLFDGLGYTLDDSLFTSSDDYNRLVVYNSLSCNSPHLYNERMVHYEVTDILYNLHLPHVKVAEFLNNVEKNRNSRFFVDSTTGIVRLIPVKDILSGFDYTDFSKDVISISSEAWEKADGYHFKTSLDADDTKFEDITTLEDNVISFFKGSVQTLDDLPAFPMAEIGDIRWVNDEEAFYQLLISKAWNLAPSTYAMLYTQFIYRGGKESIESKFSTLTQNGISLQCGNKLTNWHDITMREFFAEYNEFEVGKYKVSGKNSSSNFELLGTIYDKDLFHIYWKTYADWRHDTGTRLIKISRRMSYKEIAELDMARKYMINGTKMLISEIQVTFKVDRIMPATITAYSCR